MKSKQKGRRLALAPFVIRSGKADGSWSSGRRVDGLAGVARAASILADGSRLLRRWLGVGVRLRLLCRFWRRRGRWRLRCGLDGHNSLLFRMTG
jgi:hypothetical protein